MWWCDGSGGKTEDLGLKGPGLNPWPRQEKLKNMFSCFWLVALEPMRSTLSICILLQIHMITNSHGNGGEVAFFP